MPSTTPELRAEWWNDDDAGGKDRAVQFLRAAGYRLRRDWCWDRPMPPRNPTPKEIRAVVYLIEEWDWGPMIGYDPFPTEEPPHAD